MLPSRTRWQIAKPDEDLTKHYMNTLGVSTLMAKLIQSRGWTVYEAKEMLHIDEGYFQDPFLLKGMKEAVEAIQEAIDKGEKIRIYGDYDCDGVSSTSFMYKLLEVLQADFDYYIPDRFVEGYGLNKEALIKAKEANVDLIITVDTGISAKEEIRYGQELGLQFIVTDHHEPPAELPQCVAVINPKQPDCQYPYPHLCGAGVAFKLGQALLKRIPYEWLDIVAIGTIADLVPLTGENRAIAYYGLKEMNRTRHIGLQALIDQAGLTDQWIDEQRVGYSLGPRINACGRMAHAQTAVQLLVSTESEEVSVLAEEMERLNSERQKLVEKTTKEAIEMVEQRAGGIQPRALVVAQEGWNQGIIGIVAARLVEKYYVPAIVLSINPETGMAKGSARSIQGFNIYEALCECREWLEHFGGHPMAAGLAIHKEKLEALSLRLQQLAEQWLTDEDFIPVSPIDFECLPEEITLEAIEELEQLAPFGVGNQKPTLMLEGLQISDLRTVGTQQQHLKCQVTFNDTRLDAIGFSLGEKAQWISYESALDLIGQPAINEWNGIRKPQLIIDDIRVLQRQFFDYRGGSLAQYKGKFSCRENGALIYFRESSESEAVFESIVESHPELIPIHFNPEVLASDDLAPFDMFIFYDLPYHLSDFQQACLMVRHGERFYLRFEHQQGLYFSQTPSREEFKQLYAIIQQKGSFSLQVDVPKLSSYKGWHTKTVHFMLKVFLDLGFVTIEDKIVRIQAQAVKKDLTSSSAYQQREAEKEAEQTLLYTSFGQLVRDLEAIMTQASNKENEGLEEAIGHGF
jgi:single-stranded-DNA-specific exonuclease